MTPTGSASSPARASIPVERYETRLAAAQRLAAHREVAALLIGVGADLRYLTGYAAMPLERLTMLVVTSAPGSRPTLIVPRLEAQPARGCPALVGGFVDLQTWDETESAHRLVADDLVIVQRYPNDILIGSSSGPTG